MTSSLSQINHPLHHELPRLGSPGIIADGLPPDLTKAAERAAAGWSKVREKYDHLADTPKPGDIPPTPAEDAEHQRQQRSFGDAVARSATKRQRQVALAERCRRTIAAAEAEIAVRQAIVDPANAAVDHWGSLRRDCDAVLTSLREQYAEKIRLRDFPDAVPVSPETCGPVRRQKEQLDHFRTRLDYARKACRSNAAAIETLASIVARARRDLNSAEAWLRAAA